MNSWLSRLRHTRLRLSRTLANAMFLAVLSAAGLFVA
ncbi:invasion associated locus B family protein, partial [Mesorhizobium sp. M2D.F.Ca.ET.140.01.1.1]